MFVIALFLGFLRGLKNYNRPGGDMFFIAVTVLLAVFAALIPLIAAFAALNQQIRSMAAPSELHGAAVVGGRGVASSFHPSGDPSR